MTENKITDKGNIAENKTEKKRFSKTLRVLIILLIIILTAYLLISYLGRAFSESDNTYQDVNIPSGADNAEIAQLLEDSEIIRSASTFEMLSNILHFGEKYNPGTYSLSPSMRMGDIANLMINGITTDNGFTLPSGYTVSQTASALSQSGFGKANTFKKIASDASLFSAFSFLDGAETLEGYLYPSTYEMDKAADEYMIIVTMLNQFDHAFTSEYRQRAKELGLSIHEVVCIASVIEQATNIDSEREKISSVIHNRIAAGTQTEKDFPKTPICSPGEKSIRAALYPKENTKYLYYSFSDKLDGSHVFTDNYDTYVLNEDAYKKAYDKQKKINNEYYK